jgi:hypothetical protein
MQLALPPSGTVLHELVKTTFYYTPPLMFEENPVVRGDYIELEPKRKGNLTRSVSEAVEAAARRARHFEKMASEAKPKPRFISLLPLRGKQENQSILLPWLRELKAKSIPEGLMNYSNTLKNMKDEELAHALSEFENGYKYDAGIKGKRVGLPQVLRPEHYEFSRRLGQGLRAGQEFEVDVGLHLLGLAIAGIVLSRIGRVRTQGRREAVLLLVTPADLQVRSLRMFTSLRASHEGAAKTDIPGYMPEEAVNIWLGIHAGELASLPQELAYMKMIGIREPGRSATLELYKQYNVWDSARMVSSLDDQSVDDLSMVLSDAIHHQHGRSRDGGGKKVLFAKALYRTLVGALPVHEFLYITNRDICSILSSGGKAEYWHYQLSKLSQRLTEVLEKERAAPPA